MLERMVLVAGLSSLDRQTQSVHLPIMSRLSPRNKTQCHRHDIAGHVFEGKSPETEDRRRGERIEAEVQAWGIGLAASCYPAKRPG